MSSPEWMPLYISDYIADTRHLSTLQSGAYLHLIMHYWRHHGLPSDEKQLARITGLAWPHWVKNRDAIASLFGENWSHKRIDKELKIALSKIEKRIACGKLGGIAKSLKTKEANVAKATDLPEQTPRHLQLPLQKEAQQPLSLDIDFSDEKSHSVSESQLESKKSDFPKDAFEVWYQRYPRHTAREAARKAFDKINRLGKVAFAELLAATSRYADDPKRSPEFTPHPATWLNAERWLDEHETSKEPVVEAWAWLNDPKYQRSAGRG